MAAPKKHPHLPDDEIAHFRSIPWCAKHLSAAGAGAPLTIQPVFARRRKPRADDDDEDSLFSTTLNTPDTIAALVCFWPSATTAILDRGVGALVTFGRLVNGHAGLCHGGVVATVFDEVLSLVHPATRGGGGGGGGAVGAGSVVVVTAYLNTRYVRPVVTPGTYLLRVSLRRREGRKFFVDGAMEDEQGEVLATAESLFVETRLKL